MAIFTKEQTGYISNTIKIALNEQGAAFNKIIEIAEADQIGLKDYIVQYHAELAANSQRVSG